jgi:hypothetical protein
MSSPSYSGRGSVKILNTATSAAKRIPPEDLSQCKLLSRALIFRYSVGPDKYCASARKWPSYLFKKQPSASYF